MPHTLPSWLTGVALPWLHEEASVFGQGPLVVANAAENAALAARRAELDAAIIVGVDDVGRVPQVAEVFDILLTTASAPPRPWVQVQEIAGAVEGLQTAVKSNPNAAVALAQVLRAQRSLDFEAALLLESFAYSTLLGGAEFRRWREATPRSEPASEPGPAILLERDGETLRIILARPGNDNAMTAELRDQLVDALRTARLDRDVTTVELRSQGRLFCQGGSLNEFGSAADLALAHHIRSVRSVVLALHRLEAHSRAIIQGGAIGSGIEIAAAAREVVTDASAFFRLPEVSMGLIPGAGGTVTIARRIGWQRACYTALTGIRLRARTALAWGLVDRLSDDA